MLRRRVKWGGGGSDRDGDARRGIDVVDVEPVEYLVAVRPGEGYAPGRAAYFPWVFGWVVRSAAFLHSAFM
jgi:hypothetical protein